MVMVTATNITLDNFYSITVVCELLKLKNRTLKGRNDNFVTGSRPSEC